MHAYSVCVCVWDAGFIFITLIAIILITDAIENPVLGEKLCLLALVQCIKALHTVIITLMMENR